MAAYLDRIRRLSALLFVVSVAIVFAVVQVPSQLPSDPPRIYALLAVALATAAGVYWFPWRRVDPNWFLVVGTSASGMIALLIALSGGRESIFFPLFVFVVVASAAYYAAVPLAVLTATVSLASLSYLLYTPLAVEALLRSAVEITIYVVSAYLCHTLLRGLVTSDEASRRIQAEVADRRRAEQALRLLTEASAALSTSLDFEATLRTITALAVPALADWCRLDIVDGAGRQERGAFAAADPAKDDLLREMQRRYPLEPGSPQPAYEAFRSGEPRLLTDLTPGEMAACAHDGDHATLLSELGTSCMIAAPLSARGRTLGAITLAVGAGDRRYDGRDMALALELARRAAMALDNARLHGDLQRALETRDEFLSHAAHDLKNPLTTARAQSQLLRSWTLRPEPPSIERIRQGFDRLDASVTKMARLIDELRDVANLEAGRALQLRREQTDLVTMARQSVAEYQLATRRHQLRLEALSEELSGNWDAGRLDRLLANLLDNALKYTPNGGEIVVTVGRREVDGEPWAVLSVADPGIGIPTGDLPHIFNRYHRAANVVRRIVGSGIGLAGVRAIAEQHGGRIEVESAEGDGSTFTVWLPVELAAPQEAEQVPVPSAAEPV